MSLWRRPEVAEGDFEWRDSVVSWIGHVSGSWWGRDLGMLKEHRRGPSLDAASGT